MDTPWLAQWRSILQPEPVLHEPRPGVSLVEPRPSFESVAAIDPAPASKGNPAASGRFAVTPLRRQRRSSAAKGLRRDPRGVCAVVVTHNPDEQWPVRLRSVCRQVSEVVVVDNGSGGPQGPIQLSGLAAGGIDVITNPWNRGVAAALDQGMEWAIKRGYPYALTLDQDSQPADGMVEALLEVYRRHPRADSVAIAAPQLVDSEVGARARYLRLRLGFWFERVGCSGVWLEGVTSVITSGSLHSTRAYGALGGFREDLFIDFVDTEYCLRAQRHGYQIVVACEAMLEHRLGDRRRMAVGPLTLFPTFHSPFRWYYLSRNRIPMIRMYALRFPHWFTYEVIASTYGMLRMLLFEDRRIEKLKAILKGTVDGFLGRLGPGPLGSA